MIMKKFLLLPLLLIFTISSQASIKGFETDYNTAVKKAAASNKNVMMVFTGSDWCPPCIMMEKNVFSKSDFIKTASKDYVLLVLDFPRKDPALKKKNEPYAAKYGVNGFPTVVLINGKKKELSRTTATAYPSVKQFLSYLTSVKASPIYLLLYVS